MPKDGITAECAFKKALEWEENIQKMLIELHDSGENDPHVGFYKTKKINILTEI